MKNRIIVITLIVLVGIPLFLYTERPWEKSFTVIVLPDTQKYSESYPEIFCNQTEWIEESKEKLGIIFVSHMGDIVDNGSFSEKEWETASECMGKLDGVVPYSIIPGNHDLDETNNKSSGFDNFNKYFPVSRFSRNDWYKGNFNENQNGYQIIEESNLKIMFINLEIEPSDEALVWANNVISSNPDLYTIVTTHKYLPDESKTRDRKLNFSSDGNTGEDIWNKLIKNNCQTKIVLSGHYHSKYGENRIESLNSCGKPVHQILQDYQSEKYGGNGKLRVYTFIPKEKTIAVSTYSPHTDSYDNDADSRFSIPIIE
jgi:hypothetical protein